MSEQPKQEVPVQQEENQPKEEPKPHRVFSPYTEEALNNLGIYDIMKKIKATGRKE